MLFALYCVDKPNSLALRMATREAHLAYARTKRDQVKFGGPLLDDAAEMAGSLTILDVPDRETAEAFTRDDPYTRAGLWQRVEIHGFRTTFGDV